MCAAPTPLRHVPVMLDEVLAQLCPRDGGIYIDGTFGAGGYSRGILDAADCRVIGVDRDPDAIAAGQDMVAEFTGRLTLVHGQFGALADHVAAQNLATVQGIVLDVGVSSMQLDEGERGFSFMRDGPLDMRMAQDGQSAADVVNSYDATDLARIIYVLGEEQRSRAIAKAIVAARAEALLATTFDLVKAIERATGPQRPQDRTHPATRTFQALRIYVNQELRELADALLGAEQSLGVDGRLVVVSFHSLEDRIVKRFFTARSGNLPTASRHMPGVAQTEPPSFDLLFKGHLSAGDNETSGNPRARSAKLRAGQRTAAPVWPFSYAALDVPLPTKGGFL
jgi:16S rRNA (cytosine1402-N4)-methyltransferase